LENNSSRQERTLKMKKKKKKVKQMTSEVQCHVDWGDWKRSHLE
jgi:hypothetical protein